LTNRRVLIVEDEYFVADDIARAVTEAGGEVVGPAPTEAAALALLALGPVDVGVLDVGLRSGTAFPIADVLLARGTPFVFATGYSRACLPEGYQNVVTWEKPFDPSALAQRLAELANDLPFIATAGEPLAPSPIGSEPSAARPIITKRAAPSDLRTPTRAGRSRRGAHTEALNMGPAPAPPANVRGG
jgi:CheY-like chemotaxis protein